MTVDLSRRAARAALFQRRRGDRTALRLLYRRSFSLLRYFHRAFDRLPRPA